MTAQNPYAINFSEQYKRFCLSLHYNGVNSYLFVNGVEICKFKAKDNEINAAPLYLGNISNVVSIFLKNVYWIINFYWIFSNQIYLLH